MAFPLASARLFVPIFPFDMGILSCNFGDRWVASSLQWGHSLTSRYGLYSFYFCFVGISANVIFIGSWETLPFLASETFWWLPKIPRTPLLHTFVQFSEHLYTTSSLPIPYSLILLCLINYLRRILKELKICVQHMLSDIAG